MTETQIDASGVPPSIRHAPLRPRDFSGKNHFIPKTPSETVAELTLNEYNAYCDAILTANSDREVSNQALLAKLSSWHPRFDGQFIIPTLRTIRTIDPNRAKRFDAEKNEVKQAIQKPESLTNFKISWINDHAQELSVLYGETPNEEVKREIGAIFMNQLELFKGGDSDPRIRPAIKFFVKNFDTFKDFFLPIHSKNFFKKGILASNHSDQELSNEDYSDTSRDVLDLAMRVINDPESPWALIDAAYQGLAVGQREVDSQSFAEDIESYMAYKIRGFGLNANEILRVWSFNFSDTKRQSRVRYPEFIADNFDIMQRLETERKGICAVLYREFGIHNFSRYPFRALINQYDQRDQDLPYGVLVYPHTDGSGAFSRDVSRLDKFYEDLLEVNTAIRIYEAGSRAGVLRRFAFINKKYGERNKISFAVLGGHGMPDFIEFGHSVEKDRDSYKLVSHALYKKDLRVPRRFAKKDSKGATISELKSWFIDRPSFVLVACSTGADAGIGDQIYKLGGDVIAPKVPSDLEYLTAGKRTNGKLWIGAWFYDPEGSYKPEQIYRHFRQKVS